MTAFRWAFISYYLHHQVSIWFEIVDFITLGFHVRSPVKISFQINLPHSNTNVIYQN